MRRLGVKLLVSVALVGSLSACGTTGKVDSSSPKGDNASSSSSDSGDSPSPSPSADTEGHFGQTITYDDGLSVRVDRPRPYKPTDTAAFDKAPAYVSVQVTIVNKTGKVFDPSGFSTSLQSGDTEAGEIYDSPKLNGAPSTKILDGRQSRFVLGYSVQNPRDLVLDVTVDFDHDDAIFTNTSS